MGKLHTLRRAIERNPKAWYTRGRDGEVRVKCPDWRRGRVEGSRRRYSSGWKPSEWSWFGHRSYKAFVKHVLYGLGIADTGPSVEGSE